MTVDRVEHLPPEDEAERAMRLLADGVPLQLLVDIALPLTLIRALFADSERAGSP